MVGFVGMINSIFSLLIELVWSEYIKEIAIANENSSLLILIIIGGFLISAILSILASILGSEYIRDKQKVYIATLLSFLLNLFIWIAISYIFVLKKYPGILLNLSGIEKIIAFPKMMMNFSVYVLSNLTLLWLYAGWTHVIIYVILLKLFKTETTYKLKKYDKGTFW